MFKWDGSDISDFIKDEKTQIKEGIYGKKVYWKIKHEEKEEICLKRNVTTTFPCLIDELKPVFELEKIGTHWFKFKGKKMILMKLKNENNFILEEVTLDQIGYNKKIEEEVQKIFVFREILGTSKNYEKNIILRKKGFFIKPISFYETNMTPSSIGKVIPDTILDKWFKETNLDASVLKLFKVEKMEDINKVLLELKNKLMEIFNRVDPNAITNIDEILSRIRSRLQFVLD